MLSSSVFWRGCSAALPLPLLSIVLPSGTLLETSCVETYRIATCTADRNDPNTLHVVEYQRPAFAATVSAANPENTLQLRQVLAMGNKETRDLMLTAVNQEMVRPDLRK